MAARPQGVLASGVSPCKLLVQGEMAEWLKAHAWKACIPQGIQGSNPCLSATLLSNVLLSYLVVSFRPQYATEKNMAT